MPGSDVGTPSYRIQNTTFLSVVGKFVSGRQRSPSCVAGLLDALARSLLVSDRHVLTARVLALNASSSTIINSVSWQRQSPLAPTLMAGGMDHSPLFELGGPHYVQESGLRTGFRPDPKYPWYENADTSPGLWSPKFMPSPTNMSYRGWWTFPYYSCTVRRWLLSYSVSIPPPTKHG